MGTESSPRNVLIVTGMTFAGFLAGAINAALGGSELRHTATGRSYMAGQMVGGALLGLFVGLLFARKWKPAVVMAVVFAAVFACIRITP